MSAKRRNTGRKVRVGGGEKSTVHRKEIREGLSEVYLSKDLRKVRG